MKKVNVLRLLITFLLIVGCQITICGDLLKSARPMTQQERIESMSMSDVVNAMISGKIDVDQAVKLINDYSYDHASGEHYYSSMNSYEKAKSIAYKMILLLERQLNACEREYIAARESLSAVEQARLDVRYNAFKTKINELISQQKIITGEAMSGLKKMLLGAAVVGVVLLVGRYMTSMNQVTQEAAEKERGTLMEKIKETELQLQAQKELNVLRWSGQDMIDRKREERNIESSLENAEWQYKENIAQQQKTLMLTEQERKQLRKQAWFDIAASYALTGISLLLGRDMPLTGRSILIPIRPFGYMPHPMAMLVITAAITGAVGVDRFRQSTPVNPH